MSLKDFLKGLSIENLQYKNISFKEITTDDDLEWATIDIAISEDQKELVNPVGYSLGRAYLNPANNIPFLIINEINRPIGFILITTWCGQGKLGSWSYLIDKKYQRKGYGLQAAELAVQLFQKVPYINMVKLSTESENIVAQKLYEKCGFTRLDELDGDDLVYALDVNTR